MASNLRLFYWPTSSASQKALMALEEKDLEFKRTIVNITKGEQNQSWFLRINPAGEVPALQIGESFISESDIIVETLDKLKNGTQLVPNPSTPEGKLVQYWRQKFSEINIFLVTFGTIANPQLACEKLELPAAYTVTKEGWEKRLEIQVSNLLKVKAFNPELAGAVDKKIENLKARLNTDNLEMGNAEQALQSLEKIFDEIEDQLRKSRTDNIVEHWLCGPNFTASDITLTMLLGRLNFLKLFPRFVNAEKRPALVEYWAQACRRPSVQKVVLGSKVALIKYEMDCKVKKLAIGTALATGMVALGLFLGHKYKS
ncbi:hypothetical protein RRG08_026202 [Elysia crispata]|uniref:GST N-terminal domain-containing protein n=1 Tax=Elysia crispata TaxID=231223 RepID=A0AAE0ZAE6_9GAST|nr:hypothetical protein RRG08_026202 [Elysia crispata]KAK3765730.1 hypothetical protein RRG08_026202 [Elysia crispata]